MGKILLIGTANSKFYQEADGVDAVSCCDVGYASYRQVPGSSRSASSFQDYERQRQECCHGGGSDTAYRGSFLKHTADSPLMALLPGGRRK